MTDSAGTPARGYSWPPFQPGHTLSTTHGAHSPRTVDPLAASIVADLLASPSCPAHLKDDPERWRPTLDGWGRAEAIVRVVSAWLDGQDLSAAMAETTTALETTTEAKGKSVKRTAGRRTQAGLDVLARWMRIARDYANDLGLSPAAAARMRLELADKYDSALHVQAVLERDQEEASGG